MKRLQKFIRLGWVSFPRSLRVQHKVVVVVVLYFTIT